MELPPRLMPSIVRPDLPRLLQLLFPLGYGIRSVEESALAPFVSSTSSRPVFDSDGMNGYRVAYCHVSSIKNWLNVGFVPRSLIVVAHPHLSVEC